MDKLIIAGREFNSRLLIGTGKFASCELMAEAIEIGADAVLVNTAIATAADPAEMATAFKLAVEAGRMAYESGLPAVSKRAIASSPLTGFLREQ